MTAAVILCAGEGKGAWPYCGIRQKVTAPVLNVPMVRRLALDLRSLGVTEIVAVIGHRGEAVRACLADLEGVRFVEQRAVKGPVDAALAGLHEVAAPDALVCAGDIVTTKATLRRVIEEYRGRRAEALLLVAPCPPDTPHWTTVDADASGLMTDVCGHGDKHRPRFAGVAAARTDTLRKYLLRNPGQMTAVGVGAMPPVEGDIPHSFDLMRRDGIEVHTVAADGFLVDVDRPWHIVEANVAVARHAFDAMGPAMVLGEGARIDDGADIAADAKLVLGPGASIGKGCHVGGSLMLGAGSRIENGAIVDRDVVVGERTRIRDYCSVGANAVIGSDCIVGHGAEFNGVMFDVVYLYHYCCVTGLIGVNVDIGAATVCGTWRFDDGVKTQVVDGHKEQPDRYGMLTYFGDYCRTGVNVMFMPGVKVGYHSCVGAGAIVYDDVPERTMLLPKQEHVTRSWGPERYGW